MGISIPYPVTAWLYNSFLTTDNFLVRAINNCCQFGMVLYASNPNAIISPPVIIALGTIAFTVSMLDVMMDMPLFKEQQGACNYESQRYE